MTYHRVHFHRYQYREDPDMHVFGRHYHNQETPWDQAPPWAIELGLMVSRLLGNTESIMIDTSKIIAAVAAERTKVDSLIALANGQSVTMKDLSAQLAAAIATGDPAALAQVQADLDKASSDLDTETAAVTAAIAANTPPGPTPTP